MKNDGGHMGEKGRSPESGSSKEQRRQERKDLKGEILWSYATNPRAPQYEAILIDDNKLGLGMLSDRPVKESSVIRISAKVLWSGDRYATVMWCEETAPSTYRSGLLFTGQNTPF